MAAGMWGNILLVALGGAAGSVARYLTVLGAARILPGFPVGVMAANILGSFLIGVLASVLTGPRAGLSPLLVVGFLGGFTTFSAFSLDALRLWDAGQPGLAATYVLGSVVLSLVAVVAGVLISRGWA
jgi:fluoride exporter